MASINFPRNIGRGEGGNRVAQLHRVLTEVSQKLDEGGGKSAYASALEDSFDGTVEEWLTSLESTVAGPQGVGIEDISVVEDKIVFTMTDEATYEFDWPPA